DDSDFYSACLGFFQPSYDAVVCNGENANIEGSATFANQLADPVEAVVSRAKKCGSLSFIFLRVEQFDESLPLLTKKNLMTKQLISGRQKNNRELPNS
ncbi:hypothetical protein N9A98_02700, partial [Akkermansiaceae bacterium]|nr:hypothetical protein [Akkermansiaceae bacterium]